MVRRPKVTRQMCAPLDVAGGVTCDGLTLARWTDGSGKDVPDERNILLILALLLRRVSLTVVTMASDGLVSAAWTPWHGVVDVWVSEKWETSGSQLGPDFGVFGLKAASSASTRARTAAAPRTNGNARRGLAALVPGFPTIVRLFIETVPGR